MKRDSFCVNLSRHFIFNTFNCAVSLCRKNPNAASEILVAFSECLQYAAGNPLSHVSMEEELEFVENYLFIQSFRFHSRFNVKYDIDKNVQLTVRRFAIYDHVHAVLEREIKSNWKPFTMTIRVTSAPPASVSIWINDHREWQHTYEA